MKAIYQFVILVVLAFVSYGGHAQERVAQWERFEKSFTCHTLQNPFTDVELSAIFVHRDTKDTVRVNGFYDGDDQYKVRFMPTKIGLWTYKTLSQEKELNGHEGSLVCLQPEKGYHGMVQVGGDQNFVYADGTQYHPVGTTSYAWTHSNKQRQEDTYASMTEMGFNKLRFCVFPNNSVRELPDEYPFELVSSNRDAEGKIHYVWDYTRFNPKFFRHLEQCVERLKSIGVEADLILFTPYDEEVWGFDRMPMEVNMRYLKYVVSRLASYSNLWWSMANEWDLVKQKTYRQWIDMSKYVYETDPYHHLLSIHGGTATYIDYQLPYFTHASIQDQGPLYNFQGAATVRNIIHKPIIFDEVCYEGNHASRWAQLSGQEMLQRMWMGIIGGTYVTHGECFCTGSDYYTGYAFLATGGKFQGTSPKRIKFMRSILDSLPAAPRLADRSWDPHTAVAGDGTYLIYFADKIPSSWKFSLPAKADRFKRLSGGEKFKVEMIDTWNMTIETCKMQFEVKSAPAKRMVDKDGKSVKLHGKPYMLLRITRI